MEPSATNWVQAIAADQTPHSLLRSRKTVEIHLGYIKGQLEKKCADDIWPWPSYKTCPSPKAYADQTARIPYCPIPGITDNGAFELIYNKDDLFEYISPVNKALEEINCTKAVSVVLTPEDPKQTNSDSLLIPILLCIVPTAMIVALITSVLRRGCLFKNDGSDTGDNKHNPCNSPAASLSQKKKPTKKVNTGYFSFEINTNKPAAKTSAGPQG